MAPKTQGEKGENNFKGYWESLTSLKKRDVKVEIERITGEYREIKRETISEDK